MTILVIAGILLTVAILVDIITKDESQIRNLPKIVWVIIVLLFPLIGSLVWLLAGREWDMPRPAAPPAVQPQSSTTADDLAAIEAEIAFHEKQARLARLEAEVAEKRKRAEG